MVGVTSIEVKESLDNLVERLRQAETAKVKERLQVLYWLKQENAPTISADRRMAVVIQSLLALWCG